MKTFLFFILFGTAALAAETRPSVVLSYPSSGRATLAREDMINVQIEKGVYTINGTIVQENALVPYVNDLLKSKPSGVVCVYLSSTMTFGDVVRSLDRLRETNATTVAVSRALLETGAKS